MNKQSINKLRDENFKINNSYYLFNFIEFFSIWENKTLKYYKLFKLPILKIKKREHKNSYYLFSLLPIFKTKTKSTFAYNALDKHYIKTLKHLQKKAKNIILFLPLKSNFKFVCLDRSP